MKIFRISHDKKGYDFYKGHVIIANNFQEAINLAKHFSADEGISIWDEAIVTEVGIYTGELTVPFILLSDFNAG